MHDLVAYLVFVAPQDISASQMRNLAAIRHAYGRPISMTRYGGLLEALASAEAVRPRSLTPMW